MAERRRPAWWMYAVLGSCASYVLSVWYVHVTGPEPTGLDFTLEAPGVVVAEIQPGSAADRAGLRLGDVLSSVDGKTGRAAFIQLRLGKVGRRYDLVVDRAGERRTLALVLGRKDAGYWTSPEGLAYLADVPVVLLGTSLAWLIALRRPGDATAVLGALTLAMLPVGNTHFLRGPPPGWHALLAALPAPLVVLPMLGVAAAAAPAHVLALMLFASFPRRLVRGRWVWLPFWLPATVGVAVAVFSTYNVAFQPAVPLRVPPLLLWPTMRMRDLTFVAIPLVLIWNYRGLRDVNERRRTRVLVAGELVTYTAINAEVLLAAVPSPAARRLLEAYWRSPFFVLSALVYAMGPLAIAYAILRHRVFDVRVIVRQGLQYAVARRFLLALAPLCGVLLVADLAIHSDQTMAEAFARRGWLYTMLAAAAFAAHTKSGSWLAALDRRFFRERYDARRILGGVLTDLRQTADLLTAAPDAASRIEAALHPEFTAVLLRGPHEAAFRVIASSGRMPAPPDIPPDGKLMSLLRVLGKPVELSQSDTGWLRRQLPPEETRSLSSARVEWIFPVFLGTQGPEGLLVLAPKRSEEPYTQEDQDLLEGIAAGLALLAERLAPASAPEGRVSETAETAVMRITARYVVERELGRGGMGAVYEARDTELERSVAIKVMRPELLESAEAVARFKREARAAAGLSHPNVVTVHDFGVAEDGRAYLVMELLRGRTLRDALRGDGRYPPARAAAILRGVCSAVEAAHAQRLLHRDLKPENVFLTRGDDTEVPKILDFGVARLLPTDGHTLTRHGTATGQLVGTLSYMSPEQLKAFPPSSAWDLWALAVIAYEMLTAAHPFAAAGMAVHEAVLSGRPTPVCEHLGERGVGWEVFFARALAADTRERPATARELLTRFEAVAEG